MKLYCIVLCFWYDISAYFTEKSRIADLVLKVGSSEREPEEVNPIPSEARLNVTLKSIERVVAHLIEEEKFNFVAFRRFTQDHIEVKSASDVHIFIIINPNLGLDEQ